MKINSKSKYALLSVIYLAQNKESGGGSAKSISEKYKISKVFLEQILQTLKKHNLIDSKKGKGGGYFLLKSPDSISIYDILYPFETSLLNVDEIKVNKLDIEKKEIRFLINSISEDFNKKLKDIKLSTLLDNIINSTESNIGMYI